MDDALRERVEALERAVTDGDHDFSTLAAEADAVERLADVEERLDELEDRLAELDAATQALRGYVGNVRSVNQDVEKRADAAMAKAQALEAALSESGTAQTRNAPDDSTEGRAADARDSTTEFTSQPDTSPASRRHNTPPSASAPTPDGGLGDTQSQTGVPGLSPNEGVTAGSGDSPGSHEHRCRACGQRRPVEDNRGEQQVERNRTGQQVRSQTAGQPPTGEPTRSAGQPPNDPETGRRTDAMEPDSGEFQHPSDDPLISDETDDDTGRLARFRELL